MRLYSGPAFQPINTFLREVSRLSDEYQQRLARHPHLTFCSTIRHIINAIRKLAAVVTAEEAVMPLYRGVRGELPHGFWMPDTAGMVCGVEMGFMSTSRQKHTPMNYMAKTGMNVLWALKPMCETDEAYHRGADVAILSQFESEAEGAPRPAPKSLARFLRLRALQTPYWRVFCAQSCSRRARCWLYGSTRAQCPSLADREATREVKAHYVQARMRGPPES